MTNPRIPDRTFIDDLGRRWEWCGGEPDTWAWRITDLGQRVVVTAIQRAILDAVNTIGASLLGTTFTPLTTSPIPDADVAAMLDELRTAQR